MRKIWILVAFIGIALTAAYVSNPNFELIPSFFTGRELPHATETYTESDDSSFEVNEASPQRVPDNFGPVLFNINGSDVLVQLHIQKTGGTEFAGHLVSNLDLTRECVSQRHKMYQCLRPNSEKETWLFTKYSGGWRCGLHADWTELHACLPDKMHELDGVVKARRFFYTTTLRNPVERYISEWRHVHRGATWKKSLHQCMGSRSIVPKCYSGTTWTNVTLKEFMACEYNMANNRQTRMLADLGLVDCYLLWMGQEISLKKKRRLENILLKSATKNLQSMAFFGIAEEHEKIQSMFEYTFPFRFKHKLEQKNVTEAATFLPSLREQNKIRKLNHLDMKLYAFAKKLFYQRYSDIFSKRSIYSEHIV